MDSNTPKGIEQFLKENFHNKEFKKRYQEEKAEFIKGLEAEIGDELRTRINKIKGRLILLVGKSVKASEAAGRYAYCIKGHTILNFYSFSGKTDERIENILNAPEYHDGEDRPRDGTIVDCLSSGGAVFLGDLECHDRPFLKRFADGIRNVERKNYDKGMLIVSTTTDRDSVPEYFKELFEVIPEKQSKPTSTPKVTPEKQARQDTPVSTPQSQGEPKNVPEIQGIKVSFNKTDFIVTINGREYVFEDKQRNLFKEYNLFELLYENQHRYIKKGEIKKILSLGDNADQQVFNIKSKVSGIIKNSPYEIENQKEYLDRGGYKLTLKC